ncbi:hypothetical protein OHA72_31155 [Dactylosporangium sp. NBC_01737]|uniref:hypothetical protein n=1 Tax=Dactylosporangium sp. NBC_01737 TaxID=2975959 RepID=UPI002E101D83|nr:hypothetical protein OHA72_31155 [Dactylosporangium sp. NBC_01737]
MSITTPGSPVRDTLAALADEMPPPRFPDAAWSLGRRRRRRRRAAVSAVVLAVALAVPLWWTAGPRPGQVAGPADGEGALPSRVGRPWLWQATIGQSPPGPATVMYTTDETVYLEATTVVVGRDGSYRIKAQVLGHNIGRLSPDGGRLLVGYEGVLDLRTGKEHRPPGGTPVDWSRDGRQVLSVTERDINLVDLATGDVRQLLRVDMTTDGTRLSPTGDRIAFGEGSASEQRTWLRVVHLGGGEDLKVPVESAQDLWFPPVWSGDGRRIALTKGVCFNASQGPDVCSAKPPGRLVVVDAETGAELRSFPHPDRVLGFRGDDLLVERDHTILLVGAAGERTVMRLPADADRPEIPLDLIERGTLGGPAVSANPFAARSGFSVCAGVVALLVAYAVWRVRRRIRSRGNFPL